MYLLHSCTSQRRRSLMEICKYMLKRDNRISLSCLALPTSLLVLHTMLILLPLDMTLLRYLGLVTSIFAHVLVTC